MKTIKVYRAQEQGAGIYGTYYQISPRRGVKRFDVFTDIEEANKEADFLNRAHEYNLAPKCFGVIKVIYNKHEYIGILVQHINGVSLHESNLSLPFQYIVRDALEAALRSIGIDNTDLWGANILVTKTQKVYAVDFSPEYCEFIKKT